MECRTAEQRGNNIEKTVRMYRRGEVGVQVKSREVLLAIVTLDSQQDTKKGKNTKECQTKGSGKKDEKKA